MKLKSILFLFGAMMNASTLLAEGEYRTPQTLPLTQWQFAEAGDSVWMDAKVPGTVHQDLIDHGRLPNPFYGMNEKVVQWVEQKDWAYRTTFTVTREQLAMDRAQLEFDGLDTYADVFLNGSLILSADNMFVGHKITVTNLREGENKLYILFRSPITKTQSQWESDGFNYPADNDHATRRVSVYTRKAPYSYGWDWGIRLVTCGIWRPVRLTFFNAARINDYYVRTVSASEQKAEVDNRLEVYNVKPQTLSATLVVTRKYKNETFTVEKAVTLKPGLNTLSLSQTIEKPHLWMPNGWGEASLYDFTASLRMDGKDITSETRHVGLRTVRVVMEDDKDGKSFFFEVNGHPLFAKGANYIPDDALLPNVTTERYKQIFSDVKAAHMNMLRVWGGGIYEDDSFYDEADRNGILVWQDFLFACTTYPHDDAFLNRVRQEARYNIRRLRGHASLAMWCGNNEIYEGIRYWGWKKKYTPAFFAEMEKGYDVLFHQVLPEEVKKLDPDRFYMHGSPYEANWGRPESWRIADSHNWGIWYGQKPFESLDTEIPRFMSEYGFQAFPEMKTIRTFAEEKDFALESEVMNAHQKATIGNALIQKTMALYYKVPQKFEDLVYAGLVLQGQGIRHGIEAHRRNRPYCMGSLVWQLNDSWPVVSWSGIDYYGNWKAMHYQMQRAFAPMMIHAYQDGERIGYYLLSDCLETTDLKLTLELMDFNGKVYGKKVVPAHAPANASTLVYEQTVTDALQGKDAASSLMRTTVRNAKNEVVAENIFYFARPKDQRLPVAKLNTRTKVVNGNLEITLQANQLARDVFVEIPVQGVRFTDNFFDLLPGQKKKIVVTSPDGTSLNGVSFRIHQLAEVQ